MVHSEKHLEFLLRLAGHYANYYKKVYVATLPEIQTFGIFSNVFTTIEGLFTKQWDNGNLKLTQYCGDIKKRDRTCLPV